MAADVAAAPALDPQAEEDDGEEEYEYVFVNLEDVYSGHQDLASASEIVIEGLLTDKPKVTVANITYAGEYDDDLGSTMYFDRASLQRVPWSAPRAQVVAAIDATVRLARAAEAEAADSSFHPKQFPS